MRQMEIFLCGFLPVRFCIQSLDPYTSIYVENLNIGESYVELIERPLWQVRF